MKQFASVYTGTQPENQLSLSLRSDKKLRLPHFLHSNMLSIPLLSFAIKRTITLLPIAHLGPLATVIGTIWLNPGYHHHTDVSLQAVYCPDSIFSCSLIMEQDTFVSQLTTEGTQ